MTTTGKENRFGFLIFDDEQAERAQAGDMSAVWEFIEQNRKFLTCWAWKMIGKSRMPKNYFEPDEYINQIFVDFPFYTLEGRESLCRCIYWTYCRILYGGYRFHGGISPICKSLDAPVGVSSRSGDKEDGATLAELLASDEPTPDEELERREHVEEIAPRFYQEIMRIFGDEDAEKAQDVIETIFTGFTIGEIMRYAAKNA